jgi:hypothetical protein
MTKNSYKSCMGKKNSPTVYGSAMKNNLLQSKKFRLTQKRLYDFATLK